MRRMILGVALAAAACGQAVDEGGVKSPSDAQAVQAGTKVCISDLAGVRYALEDALRQQNLQPTGSCTAAKIRMQEAGQPRAWIMRYQRMGDRHWKECRSAENERRTFADRCIEQMLTDLGG